jgi:hypothetical protein
LLSGGRFPVPGSPEIYFLAADFMRLAHKILCISLAL